MRGDTCLGQGSDVCRVWHRACVCSALSSMGFVLMATGKEAPPEQEMQRISRATNCSEDQQGLHHTGETRHEDDTSLRSALCSLPICGGTRRRGRRGAPGEGPRPALEAHHLFHTRQSPIRLSVACRQMQGARCRRGSLCVMKRASATWGAQTGGAAQDWRSGARRGAAR